MTDAQPDPTSENEWTIHSINIHGVFLERWCQSVVSGTRPWSVKDTNHPVVFPPGSDHESALDILAQFKVDNALLTIPIECKKNNPEFVNWVFFRSQHTSRTYFPIIENELRQGAGHRWYTHVSVATVPLDLPVTDEARETRSSYRDYKRNDKTRTSNAAITDAARQVAIATQALIHDESRLSTAMSEPNTPYANQFTRQLMLPTIVTSARLYVCEFDPADVVPATGEIPYDKPRLIEHSYLLYEYPLPRHLQREPPLWIEKVLEGKARYFSKMQMIVVHSEKLADMLRLLADSARNLVADAKTQ